jgi:hypothetical protein
MEEYKRYFEKKYFIYFLLFFVAWYLGFFLLYNAYQVTGIEAYSLSAALLSPVLLFAFSLKYFKHSFNDWEERFIVGIGWVLLGTVLFAALSQFVYGVAWSEALNFGVLFSKWPDVISVLLAGFIIHRS